MSRQRQWSTEKRGWCLCAWRKGWARSVPRRRDRLDADELDELKADPRFRESLEQMRHGERA